MWCTDARKLAGAEAALVVCTRATDSMVACLQGGSGTHAVACVMGGYCRACTPA
jgi:hypothetical protein